MNLLCRSLTSAAVLAAAFTLASCGKDEKVENAAPLEAAASVESESPRPAEGFTTEAPVATMATPPAPITAEGAPVVIAANIPGSEDRSLRKAIAEIPAAMLGGPANLAADAEPLDRAFQALNSYLAKRQIPSQTFYAKHQNYAHGYWTYMFFGDPKPGEGMYVHVRIFPDGRAEIVD